MRCIICDRCKQIIENPRHCRVITCAKPLKPPINNDKVQYRGNDRQQNDIIWEKEVCTDCLDALEAFFEQGAEPTTPSEPDSPGDDATDGPDDGENEGDEQEP